MDAHGRPDDDIFEGLWLLRACYPRRSDYDACGTMSISDAIAYGEQLMRTVHLRERWRGGHGQRHPAA